MALQETDIPADQDIESYASIPGALPPDLSRLLESNSLRVLDRLYTDLGRLGLNWNRVFDVAFRGVAQQADIQNVRVAETAVIQWMNARVAEEDHTPRPWLEHAEYQGGQAVGGHPAVTDIPLQVAVYNFIETATTFPEHVTWARHLIHILTGINLDAVFAQLPPPPPAQLEITPPPPDAVQVPNTFISVGINPIEVPSPEGSSTAGSDVHFPEDEYLSDSSEEGYGDNSSLTNGHPSSLAGGSSTSSDQTQGHDEFLTDDPADDPYAFLLPGPAPSPIGSDSDDGEEQHDFSSNGTTHAKH
ncbi:MAG: hypothetical protein M4579_007122 [Chaenotheca gracillima]|nr:MAG: hypothetical protein M4579_007122 [Chaenotheca gracillima]